MSKDLEQQEEELLVLSSMFDEEFVCRRFSFFILFQKQTSPKCFVLKIKKENEFSVEMNVTIPENYPRYEELCFKHFLSEKCPSVSLSSIHYKVSGVEKKLLGMFEKGELCLYNWVNFIQTEKFDSLREGKTEEPENEFKNDIFISDTVTLKKSKFIGYACYVSERVEIIKFRNHLKLNKKIRQATHRIVACVLDDGEIVAWDNGEKGGSNVIYECLKMNKKINFAICVVRWYGGIHLNQDRFRIIKQISMELINKVKQKKVNNVKDQ